MEYHQMPAHPEETINYDPLEQSQKRRFQVMVFLYIFAFFSIIVIMMFVFMCFIFFGGVLPTVSGNMYIVDSKDGVSFLIKAPNSLAAELTLRNAESTFGIQVDSKGMLSIVHEDKKSKTQMMSIDTKGNMNVAGDFTLSGGLNTSKLNMPNGTLSLTHGTLSLVNSSFQASQGTVNMNHMANEIQSSNFGITECDIGVKSSLLSLTSSDLQVSDGNVNIYDGNMDLRQSNIEFSSGLIRTFNGNISMQDSQLDIRFGSYVLEHSDSISNDVNIYTTNSQLFMSGNMLSAQASNATLNQSAVTLLASSFTTHSSTLLFNQSSYTSSHSNITHDDCTIVVSGGSYQGSRTDTRLTNVKLVTNELSALHQNSSISFSSLQMNGNGSQLAWLDSTMTIGDSGGSSNVTFFPNSVQLQSYGLQLFNSETSISGGQLSSSKTSFTLSDGPITLSDIVSLQILYSQMQISQTTTTSWTSAHTSVDSNFTVNYGYSSFNHHNIDLQRSIFSATSSTANLTSTDVHMVLGSLSMNQANIAVNTGNIVVTSGQVNINSGSFVANGSSLLIYSAQASFNSTDLAITGGSFKVAACNLDMTGSNITTDSGVTISHGSLSLQTSNLNLAQANISVANGNLEINEGAFSWISGGHAFYLSNGVVSSSQNNWTINTASFSIVGGGNFTTDGSIGVHGSAFFDSNVYIAQNLQCKRAQVDEISSANLTLSGNFTSTGPAFFNAQLEVTGELLAKSNASISGWLSVYGDYLSAQNLILDANASIGGSIAIVGSLSVEKEVLISNDATIIGSLYVEGPTILHDSLTAGSILANESLTAVGPLHALGGITTPYMQVYNLNVTGQTKLGEVNITDMYVAGHLQVQAGLNVIGPSMFTGDLSLTGNAVTEGFMNVSAYIATPTILTTTLSAQNSNIGESTAMSISVTGGAFFDGSIQVEGSQNIRGGFNVSGNSVLNSLVVQGQTTLNEQLLVNNLATFNAPVAITGMQSSLHVDSNIVAAGNIQAQGLIQTNEILCNSISAAGNSVLGKVVVYDSINVIGMNASTFTFLNVDNDMLINGHLTVQNGMTWNGIFTAFQLTVDTVLDVLGSCRVDGSSTVMGLFAADGPAAFGATITVATSATIGTTLTVAQTVTVGSSVMTTDSVVATSFCFTDASCITRWPNVTTLSAPPVVVPDVVVFSQNISLDGGGEKHLFVGSFAVADRRKLYAELTPVDDVQDQSLGIVDYNFVFSIKNKAVGNTAATWNGGVISNDSVWIRVRRYDIGSILNFACTVKINNS